MHTLHCVTSSRILLRESNGGRTMPLVKKWWKKWLKNAPDVIKFFSHFQSGILSVCSRGLNFHSDLLFGHLLTCKCNSWPDICLRYCLLYLSTLRLKLIFSIQHQMNQSNSQQRFDISREISASDRLFHGLPSFLALYLQSMPFI